MLIRQHRILLLFVAALALSGCGALRKSPVPEAVERCRQFSRQGISAMELGKWYEAELALRRAADASPTDDDAHRHLAEALWQRGDRAGAIQQMEEARALAPDDGTVATRAGEMYLAVNNLDSAETSADAAVALTPEAPESWLLKGRIAARRGRHEDALADLHRALSLSPNDTGALAELAALHHHRGNHPRCLTTIHHWIDCYPPGQEPQAALTLEGRTYLALSRPQQASDSFLLAANRGPVDAPLRFAQAEAALASGRMNEAYQFATDAVNMDASHDSARQMVAQLSTATRQR